MSAFLEFFIKLWEGKNYIPTKARKAMKPHYDAIHNLEKKIKEHRRQIDIIKELYNVTTE